jgi:dihydroneopterin aldolase
MDWIELSDFHFETIVGILDFERETTQPISIELRMGLDLETAGTLENLANSIDYASVKDQIVFLSREGRWHLIESLALAACRMLLIPPSPGEERAPIEVVELSVTKPKILAPVAIPGVRIKRDRDWLQVDSESPAPGVTLTSLAQTLHTWLWHVQLAPGARWSVPENMASFVVVGRLQAEEDVLVQGTSTPPFRRTREVKAESASVLLLIGQNE